MRPIVLALLAVLLVSCAVPQDEGVRFVERGDRVVLAYEERSFSGTLLDSSNHSGVVEFTVGSDDTPLGVVSGRIHNAVVGMERGESKMVTVPPIEGYGPIDAARTLTIPLRDFAVEEILLNIGDPLVIPDGSGNPIEGVVVEITDEFVRIDYNHPRAGETIRYMIVIVDIWR